MHAKNSRKSKRIWIVLGIVALGTLGGLGYRFLTRDIPTYYPSIEEHFKYGSIGTEQDAGVPYWIWKVLPQMFPDKISPEGYKSFGFVFEPGHDRAIGMTNRIVVIERVGLNCGVCHTGTVRDTPDSPPRIILGMPAGRLNLQGYFRFLVSCARDPRFTAGNVVAEINRTTKLSWWDSLTYYVAFFIVKQRMLQKGEQNSFMDSRPDWGPGRVDTFNPYKGYFKMDMSADHTIGTADLPSIWNQNARDGLWLHWDGDNDRLEERNISAALAVGAAPDTLDFDSLNRIEAWIRQLPPPAYPYAIDRGLAARGSAIYGQYCGDCHNFGSKGVGQVVWKGEIGTDPHRVDSFTPELATKMNTLGTGYPWKLSHYRKTDGYSSVPLDGIWARGPYLHNGSVPTLWELLQPVGQRPRIFYRGYDVFDRDRVGFISNGVGAEAAGWKYDTSVPGNGNQGHGYGTDLSEQDKRAIVEYMKTL